MSHYHFVLLDRYKKRLLQLGEEKWRIQSLAIWNGVEKQWDEGLFHVGVQKRLTTFMNNEIDSHGNNIFETAYTAKYEPTDWKDDYND